LDQGRVGVADGDEQVGEFDQHAVHLVVVGNAPVAPVPPLDSVRLVAAEQTGQALAHVAVLDEDLLTVEGRLHAHLGAVQMAQGIVGWLWHEKPPFGHLTDLIGPGRRRQPQCITTERTRGDTFGHVFGDVSRRHSQIGHVSGHVLCPLRQIGPVSGHVLCLPHQIGHVFISCGRRRGHRRAKQQTRNVRRTNEGPWLADSDFAVFVTYGILFSASRQPVQSARTS